MTRTDSLDQTALAYIGERYPEWIARYRTNEDHSGPNHNDAINMLCLLEDAAEQIADLKAKAAGAVNLPDSITTDQVNAAIAALGLPDNITEVTVSAHNVRVKGHAGWVQFEHTYYPQA